MLHLVVCLDMEYHLRFAFAILCDQLVRDLGTDSLPISCGDDSAIQTATSRQLFLLFSASTPILETISQHTHL